MFIPTGPGRNVLLLYLLSACTTMSRGALELLYPLNLDRLGHPLSIVGVMMALLSVGSLVARLPAGAWYRSSRARVLAAGSLAVMGLSTAGLALGDAWELHAILATLNGFAFGLATTFLLALLIEAGPRGESAAPTMAWYTAAISTGYALGAPLGAQALDRFGYEAAFVIGGAVALVGAALTLALRLPSEAEPVATEGRTAAGVAATVGWRTLAHLPAGVWLAALLGFYINVVSETYYTFFPIYAVGLGISLGTIGVVKSVHSLSATGIRFVAAGIFRVVDVGIVNHAAVVAMALGMVVLSVVTGEVLLALTFVLLGTSRGLLRVTSATMIAAERGRPGASIGMASGVYNAGLDAGAVIGPPITGAVAGLLDIPTTFRLVAVALPTLYYVIWFAQRARAARSVVASG